LLIFCISVPQIVSFQLSYPTICFGSASSSKTSILLVLEQLAQAAGSSYIEV
jgi:hypothetical protein